MSKKIIFAIIAAVLLIGLIVGVYVWNKSKTLPSGTENLNNAGEAADKIIEDATKGALPSINTNPLEGKPDINPADKANAFDDIKINPFK